MHVWCHTAPLSVILSEPLQLWHFSWKLFSRIQTRKKNQKKKKKRKKPFSSSRKTIIILIFSSHSVPTSQLLSSELSKLCARTFLSTMINLARGYLKSLGSCLCFISASHLQQQCLPPGVHRCDCLVCSRYRDMSQKRGRTGILMLHLTEITSQTSV